MLAIRGLRALGLAAAALSGWAIPGAAAECAGAGAAADAEAIVQTSPSDAELRRAGLVPLPAPRPEAELPDAAPPAEAPAGPGELPPPRILSAAPAPLPEGLPEGLEEVAATNTQWGAPDWAGPLKIELTDAPAGGLGRALHLSLDDAEGDGRRPPAEKWGAALALASPPDGAASLSLDVHNGMDWPVKLAVGVVVAGSDGARVYYESPPRRLHSGWNRGLAFSGAENSWKTARNDWRHQASWAGRGRIREVVFLLYDAPAAPGVHLDRIRIF